MSRPTWDEYFMELAKVVAKRSTCLRQNVGAIIVKDKRILATGYNGAPSGLDHCLDIGCLREKLNVPSGERQELCLTPDVEVLTEDGFKKIREIKAGCKVLTHSGSYADVTKVLCRDYEGIVCVVKPKGLLPITLTPEHEVLAIKTVRCKDKKTICKESCQSVMKEGCGRPYEGYEEDWIPAMLLNRGDLLIFGFDTRTNDLKTIDLSKYVKRPPSVYYKVLDARKKGKSYDYIERVYGVCRSVAWNTVRSGMINIGGSPSKDIPAEVEVSEDLMWLFGIYLAEGCSSGNQVAFCLNRNEEDIAERIAEIMKDYFGLKPYEYRRGSSLIVKYSSKILAEVFANMLGRNSYTMRISSELMTLKPSLQKHILYGWLEGDGYDNSVDVRGVTASKALALQMLQICLRLGALPTLDYSPPRRGVKSSMYRLRINKNPKLKKRYLKDGRLYTPVDKIETKFYRGKVYNLEVDRYYSFATESFIVHNCRGLHAEQNAIIQAAKFGICIEGATMYTTHCPCITCAKMIINAGIKKVVYGKEYADKRGLELLKEAGIEVVYMPIDDKPG
jgi:deoxycytidylate deaminase